MQGVSRTLSTPPPLLAGELFRVITLHFFLFFCLRLFVFHAAHNATNKQSVLTLLLASDRFQYQITGFCLLHLHHSPHVTSVLQEQNKQTTPCATTCFMISLCILQWSLQIAQKRSCILCSVVHTVRHAYAAVPAQPAFRASSAVVISM
jgi:hypothetical protein